MQSLDHPTPPPLQVCLSTPSDPPLPPESRVCIADISISRDASQSFLVLVRGIVSRGLDNAEEDVTRLRVEVAELERLSKGIREVPALATTGVPCMQGVHGD